MSSTRPETHRIIPFICLQTLALLWTPWSLGPSLLGCSTPQGTGPTSSSIDASTPETSEDQPRSETNNELHHDGSEPDSSPSSLCDDGPGAELVELVNTYRSAHQLSPIPCSPSLMVVARTHVRDLASYPPQDNDGCNLHSWSSHGNWTACCYTPDHAAASCMWSKPKELTSYPGSGYENAAQGVSSASQALRMWQNDGPHNDVILNQGMWKAHPWKAVGAAIHDGYASLWFGEELDPVGEHSLEHRFTEDLEPR